MITVKTGAYTKDEIFDLYDVINIALNAYRDCPVDSCENCPKKRICKDLTEASDFLLNRYNDMTRHPKRKYTKHKH